ncbi:MAG: hypothetical protein ACPF9L_06670, partial [Candidatus Poseidoniaceae archaeon]
MVEEVVAVQSEDLDTEQSDDQDSTIEVSPTSQELLSIGMILKNVSIHAMTPLIIGLVVGGLWQYYASEDLIANLFPPQVGLLAILILSPIMYFLTIPRGWDEYGYYMIGQGSIFVFLFMLWFAGFGALFCGAYGITILWFALMPNWTRRLAAPAKIGFMHVIA